MNQKYKNVLSSLISEARTEQTKERAEEQVYLKEHKLKVNDTALARKELEAKIQELEMLQNEKYLEVADEQQKEDDKMQMIEARLTEQNQYVENKIAEMKGQGFEETDGLRMMLEEEYERLHGKADGSSNKNTERNHLFFNITLNSIF